ncbi:metal-binding protein [Leptothermofonsia sp. ETS-13]|uniref:metal-binding protein n=1 Tax=Leptothermofonsia sp. ETS-13 TaxID=3035696 RepID=UPI003BA2536C
MPSGRTHDSITLWSLPLVAGLTFERTQSSNLTLMVSGGFLFSGLMFGPDLDIYSRQYCRWGPLRWIWLPYRQGMRHRSILSHGPLVGTVVRILYLLSWVGAFGLITILLGAIAAQWLGFTDQWQRSAYHWLEVSTISIGQLLQKYPAESLALGIGLELGALSHSFCDWGESVYKRHFAKQADPRSKTTYFRDRPPESFQASFNLKPPKLETPPPNRFIKTVSSRIQNYFQEKPLSSSAQSPPSPPHLKKVPQLPPFVRQRRP